EHRAHRPAGNDAGTGGRRLEQHAARAVLAQDLVRDRGAGAGELHHPALGRLDCLPDRLGDLVGLPRGDADLPLAVPDGHERVEREAPAALDHLGHAVDGDHVLDELVGAVAVAPVTPLAALATPAAAALAAPATAAPAAATAAA